MFCHHDLKMIHPTSNLRGILVMALKQRGKIESVEVIDAIAGPIARKHVLKVGRGKRLRGKGACRKIDGIAARHATSHLPTGS
jgi:hypothetical protein